MDDKYLKGSGLIQVEKTPWRPKLPCVYIDPDPGEDLLEGYEFLHKDCGHSVIKDTNDLPPRNDIIQWDPTQHQKEFDSEIRWGDCPKQYQPMLTKLIQDNWDAFCHMGLAKPIRGFECRIDTGNAAPVSCKAPRYGPHESAVMLKLLEAFENNRLIEPDDGPYGALIVLAAKPNQEEVPWHEYVWRLCVSYRRLN